MDQVSDWVPFGEWFFPEQAVASCFSLVEENRSSCEPERLFKLAETILLMLMHLPVTDMSSVMRELFLPGKDMPFCTSLIEEDRSLWGLKDQFQIVETGTFTLMHLPVISSTLRVLVDVSEKIWMIKSTEVTNSQKTVWTGIAQGKMQKTEWDDNVVRRNDINVLSIHAIMLKLS